MSNDGRDQGEVSIGYLEDDNPIVVPRWAYNLIRQGAVMDHNMEQLKKKRRCQQARLKEVLDELKVMLEKEQRTMEEMYEYDQSVSFKVVKIDTINLIINDLIEKEKKCQIM